MPDKPSTILCTLKSGLLSLSQALDRRQCGTMRTHCGYRNIRPVFHHSFRRPVKIRVETEPPHSADRIAPHLPAGVLFLATRRLGTSPQAQLRVVRLELPPPDWRIVGDHDVKLEEDNQASEV